MSLQCPEPIDVTDIQFKLHNKYKIGSNIPDNIKHVNLLASASSIGLVIIGYLQPPSLRVTLLNSIIDSKDHENVPVRVIPLSGIPLSIALSCDDSQLAISITQNGQGFIAIYIVSSFLTTNVNELIRIPVEANVSPIQMIWNPVIPNTLAVCYNSGALEVYNIKGTTYEFFAIDKSEQTQCASWSPKGKQIVVGFPNGKLAQYKPDLKLAKTIPCLVNIFQQPFNVIALQWLSTYQFAAVFLEIGGSSPALHVINAPKTGTPVYINYDDICFSQAGPRMPQIYLTHIAQWNMLLVGCANSMEIAVLGTTETTEMPKWTQYAMLDEARAELPLTEDAQEPSPVGLSLDTGCTHQLTIGEHKLPVAPMIHLLSTDGLLVCFNFLNTRPQAPSICSPPTPFSDTSGIGEFKEIVSQKQMKPIVESNVPGSYTSFGQPLSITSTPTVQKTTSFFGPTQPYSNLFPAPVTAEPSTQSVQNVGNLLIPPIPPPVNTVPSSINNEFPFAQQHTPPTWTMQVNSSIFSEAPNIGKPVENNPINFSNSNKPIFNIPVQSIASTNQSVPLKPAVSNHSNLVKNDDTLKPFITVSPVYNASVSQANQTTTSHIQSTEKDADQNNEVIKKIMLEEIQSFESLLCNLLNRSQITIKHESKDEAQKQLNCLTNIVSQAVESTDELRLEIHTLKLSINETFSMAEEAKSKYNSSNESINDFSMSHTSRRQLEKLQKLLTINEHQIQFLSKEIGGRWSAYQDALKQNKKNKMHIPSLENVYQTLSKEREILNRHRMRINYLRDKLGFKNINVSSPKKKENVSLQSLSESLLSITLADEIKSEKKSFSHDKQMALRNLLKNRTSIVTIQSKKSTRKGFNSEIVLEKRLNLGKLQQMKSTMITVPVKAIPDTVAAITNEKFESQTFSIKPIKPTIEKIKQSIKVEPQPIFNFSKDSTKSSINQSITNQNITTVVAKNDFDAKPTTTSGFNVGFTSAIATNQPSAFSLTKTDSKLSELSGFNFKPTLKFDDGKPVAKASSATSLQIGKPNDGLPSKSATLFNASVFPENQKLSTSIPSFGSISSATGTTVTATSTTSKPTAISFGSTIASPIPFGSKVQFDKTMPSAAKQPAGIESEAFKFSSKNDKKSEKENIISSDLSKLLSISEGESIQVIKPTSISPSSSPQQLMTKSTVSPSFSTVTTSPSSIFSGFNLNQSQKNDSIVVLVLPPNKNNDPPPLKVVSTSPANGSVISTTFQTTTVTSATISTTTAVISKPTTAIPSAQTFSFASFTADTPPPDQSNDVGNILQDLNICKPSASTSPSTNGGHLFSLNSFNSPPSSQQTTSVFGTSTTPITTNTITTSTTTTTTNRNIFGVVGNASIIKTPTTNAPIFGNLTTTATTSVQPLSFANNTTSIFGATQANSNAFSTNNSLVFGGSTNQLKTENIFGGNSGSSIFSGSSPKQEATTTSIFGNANVSAAETKNIFGQSNATQSASGGSIFTASSFGSTQQSQAPLQHQKSIFGGNDGNQPTSSFAPPVTAGLFGSNNNSSADNSTSSFRSESFNSPAFGQPIAQTDFRGTGIGIFGGTQQQSQQSQSKPHIFGFATQFAAFGEAATFGTPKTGFGTFANMNLVSPSSAATTAGVFGSDGNISSSGGTVKNALFETLGSTETGMTFGNIAQNATNVSKPAFTPGSSFSTWR